MANDGVHGTSEDEVQNLLLHSGDINGFLNEFAQMMAENISEDGEDIWCAITLLRERKAATVASSNSRARALDEIQFVYGDGPCLTAAREHELVHVPDMRQEGRWPEYKDHAAVEDIRSVLGVPFELEGEGRAALNVYSQCADRYDDVAVKHVQQVVLLASKALQLAVRLAGHREREADMETAMGSRTTIDLAVGMIMGQNSCSQDAALNILKSASSSRNIKLRDVAADMVASVGQGQAATTHFDR